MKKQAKAAKKAEPAKKAKAAAPAKAMAKSTKKPEPKVKLSTKADKKSAKLEVVVEEVISIEAAEEMEEEMESAAAARSGASDAGLAIAAATTEASAGSLKNFRHHPDIENFYRFIYENDLRYEGLEIIDMMMSQRATQKNVKASKAKAH